ncbi:DHH-type phosphohydrolase [Campylobacter insulaenigrae]|uniref:DHH-type phosphohydrolase n=1 Tax=Campylobacter insulaenigrae NCTC 12927 TaxID=1031564 RepID=A0A0A8H1D1_9BACT|nr:DHH-type phosphohydrolase [Campylobacter insulaenigrae]AJC87871.1 DHH-type phosphohydrolase [Campylobacter insulaenigrae NCTC 12927]MCR6570346.1 DHH-type phosphohydrolase [Campylobacter insulaenigrae]MCR6571748.1 DHH-type phosphohydrolase [Campylobacter insulaenigrae]MCR6573385.1 DHH-type phosphohydrolase [Campylobacter insulaenigrae]MCR6574850.1 DHH-type phosphohydrolase [Campylobacter insulaenigrae]
MKIYHLSHTDLDGYACQYVVNFYFKNCFFYNSNYGKEINENFNVIFKNIEEDLKNNPQEEFVILITDLNLNLNQCEEFQKAVEGKKIKLLLLDHHQSGLECALKYPWYFLDDQRCATKIVYDFFSRCYGKSSALNEFVDVVNAVDIWLSEDKNFELGKVLLGMVSSAKEINRVMFSNENIEYIFYLFEQSKKYIQMENSHIVLDNDLHGLKKSFFIKDNDDTLSNLISKFVVERLSFNKNKFSIFYKGQKGLLTSNIGNTSVIGNDFLNQNPDFDFFVDVSSRKTLSFRANNKLDVSLMAKNLVNGGGHKNASGGLFAAYKDSSNYEFIKAQFNDLIKNKELKETSENKL